MSPRPTETMHTSERQGLPTMLPAPPPLSLHTSTHSDDVVHLFVRKDVKRHAIWPIGYVDAQSEMFNVNPHLLFW